MEFRLASCLKRNRLWVHYFRRAIGTAGSHPALRPRRRSVMATDLADDLRLGTHTSHWRIYELLRRLAVKFCEVEPILRTVLLPATHASGGFASFGGCYGE
jgi:hypothetical protein